MDPFWLREPQFQLISSWLAIKLFGGLNSGKLLWPKMGQTTCLSLVWQESVLRLPNLWCWSADHHQQQQQSINRKQLNHMSAIYTGATSFTDRDGWMQSPDRRGDKLDAQLDLSSQIRSKSRRKDEWVSVAARCRKHWKGEWQNLLRRRQLTTSHTTPPSCLLSIPPYLIWLSPAGAAEWTDCRIWDKWEQTEISWNKREKKMRFR